MRKLLSILVIHIFTGMSVSLYAQKVVSIITKDGLEIVGDLFVKDKSNPFILLFHQSQSSRGEYKEIAQKLLNLNYNCLAVDLRHGLKMNHVQNQTAHHARLLDIPNDKLDALDDVYASIDYIYRQYQKPVILFGSEYSASLSMLAGLDNYKVKAVVAFSPGEYFRPRFMVKDSLTGFEKPLFIAASDTEKPFITELVKDIPSGILTTYYQPENGTAMGAKMLWDEHTNNQKYWFELLVFFKGLEKK